jgi:hypothetical protein
MKTSLKFHETAKENHPIGPPNWTPEKKGDEKRDANKTPPSISQKILRTPLFSPYAIHSKQQPP